jgi:hypothetical protein
MKTLRKKIRGKKCKNKNRKNKTQKKCKKGGKINHLVPSITMPTVNIEIPNSEIEFAKSKLTDSFEYCGKYVTDNISGIKSGTTCILRRHQDNAGALDKKGRPFCDIYEKQFYGIVWHTHPNTSKFYPSTEDIIMVKKTRDGEQIKLSVIYTSIGIWTLQALGDDLDTTEIEKINADFYRNCFRGRPTTPGFNLQHVLDYIRFTYSDEMFAICEMNILFEPYTPDQTINISLPDVRVDALTA